MEDKKKMVFMIFVVLLSFFISGVTMVIDSVSGCGPGWLFIQSQRSYCVQVGTATNWGAAFRYCHGRQAKILAINEAREYQQFLSTHGVSVGWTGEFVANGRLLSDGLIERTTVYGSMLNASVFTPTRDRGCGIFNISVIPPVTFTTSTTSTTSTKSSTSTTSTTSTTSIQNVTFPRPISDFTPSISTLLYLTNCSDELPVVCVKPPDDNTTKILLEIPYCPKGWLGNISTTNCYRLYPQQVSYWNAKKSCSDNHGNLLNIQTNLQLELAARIIHHPLYKNGIGSGGLVWVDGKEGSCNTFSVSYNRTILWDCQQQLGYICSRSTNYPSIQPRLTFPRTVQFVSRQIRAGEMELIAPRFFLESFSEIQTNLRCSVSTLIPKLQKLQWVKDGAILPMFSRGNVTNLDLGGVLREVLYREGTGLTGNNPLMTQDILGYYWCEVVDLSTNTNKQSSKIYLNTAETKTYAVSLKLSKPYVDPVSAYRFNLMNDILSPVRDVLTTLQQVTGEVPVEKIVDFPSEISPPVPVTKVNRFRSEGRIVDFQIFDPVNVRNGLSEQAYLLDSKKRFLSLYNISNISDGNLLKFISSDYCLSRNISFLVADKIHEVVLPDTLLGGKYETDEICGVDQQSMGVVVCEGDKIYGAYWTNYTSNQNCNFSGIAQSPVTTKLSDLTKNITDDNVATIVKDVKNITDNSDVLSPIDVIYITVIIDQIANTTNITEQVVKDVVDVINNVLKTPTEDLKTANIKLNTTNKLLTSLDEIELKADLGDDNRLTVVTPETVVDVWKLKRNIANPVIGLSINGDKTTPIKTFETDDISSLFAQKELIYETTDVGILLHRDFVQTILNEHNTIDVRLAMHVFKDSRLFISNNNATGYEVNSKIISATLAVDGVPVTNLNGSFVTTVFFPQKVLNSDVRSNYSICAYWDLKDGRWSTDGCSYSSTISGRDVCLCDHLTNFAVLLDYYGQQNLVSTQHQLALSIISIIGLTFSIAGLGITVLSFLVFRKLRKGRAQQTMFNLALAMLCSWIVFLSGINQTDDHVGCIVVAVLLHYFIMASFMWMLMEGILQYLLFVKVLGTYFHNYMWKTAIPAWGLPIVPLAIMLGIDVELYNGGNTYCWMSLPGFYYGFALPVGLIILANIVIYVMVTHSICSRKSINTDCKSSNQTTVTNVRASFCCFIILGVSWVFGFLAISDARLVFQYLFTIINSLQGFLIFVLFTARDQNVRDYWKALCCRKSTGKTQSGNNSVPSNTTPKNSSDVAFTDVRKNSTPTTSLHDGRDSRPFSSRSSYTNEAYGDSDDNRTGSNYNESRGDMNGSRHNDRTESNYGESRGDMNGSRNSDRTGSSNRDSRDAHRVDSNVHRIGSSNDYPDRRPYI